MNAPVTAQATETARIEAALDALLSAAIAADSEPPLLPQSGPMSAAALTFKVMDRMRNWTQAQQAAADLMNRPVWEAVRQAISSLGVRLHEIGGPQLMLEVCYRVAALDPATEGRRIHIIDKRWDGIGTWIA